MEEHYLLVESYAVVRSGSTTTLYVNGSSVANYTDNLNYTGGNTRGLYIGTQNGTAGRFGGYISNLRLIKGTQFIPETSHHQHHHSQ